MTDLPAPINRHVVDRLADVRRRIAELEAEAAALRAEIIETGGTVGDEHIAVVCVHSIRALDRRALIAVLGRDVLRPFMRSKEVTYVNLQRKGERA